MTLDDKKVAEIVSRVVERIQASTAAKPAAVLPLSSKERGPGGEVGEGCWKPRKKISPDEPIKSKWSSRRQSGEAATEVPTTNPQSAIRNPQSEAVPRHPSPVTRHNTGGVYDDVNAAVEAAQRAQNELSKLGFSRRFCIVEAMRKAALENLERWSHEAVAETKMGRAEDKMKKNRLVTLKTPGPEILQQPEAFSGTYGLTTIRLDPFGVIASIIPCTNSTETVINNGIGMISAGNAVVFNPHPIAKNVSADCVRTLNAAIAAAGGPSELLCCIADPTIESANALMAHPLTPLVVVTGGGAVVEAAMKSGKRAICAGPGNPPAVVDETADLAHAAKAIVRGASLDNNVVCTDEKAVLAVDSIADELKALMLKENCIELKGVDIERLTKLVLVEATPHANSQSEIRNPKSNFAPNKKLVGKNASHILRELGITADESVRLVLVDVDKDHPLIHAEQLMPVLPLCRLKDADAATAHAAAVEAGRRHTASIHSQRTDRITQFVNTMNVSICVANDANYAGLGLGGEGYTSFSIATPTGEGMTTARNFCRERRMAICGGGLSRK